MPDQLGAEVLAEARRLRVPLLRRLPMVALASGDVLVGVSQRADDGQGRAVGGSYEGRTV